MNGFTNIMNKWKGLQEYNEQMLTKKKTVVSCVANLIVGVMCTLVIFDFKVNKYSLKFNEY